MARVVVQCTLLIVISSHNYYYSHSSKVCGAVYIVVIDIDSDKSKCGKRGKEEEEKKRRRRRKRKPMRCAYIYNTIIGLSSNHPSGRRRRSRMRHPRLSRLPTPVCSVLRPALLTIQIGEDRGEVVQLLIVSPQLIACLLLGGCGRRGGRSLSPRDRYRPE